MLHSRKLLYLDEIARSGSIRKAADRLNVSSSAINRQILALEEEFGVPLFERLPRGLRLTAAGELCIEHIRGVLKDYARLETRIRALKMPHAGQVSLVTTVGLASGPLPEIIAKFIETNPRVHIKLRSDGGTTTINPVLTGEVDIGLGFNIAATPGLRTLATFDIPIGAVVPPDHRLAQETGPVDLVDVVQERLVLAQSGTSLRDVINLVLSSVPIPVEPVLETNSSETVRQLVRRGIGISLLNPLDVLAECRRGELVFRPLNAARTHHQPMKLFTRARASMDAATSLFVEFLLQELVAEVEELQRAGSLPA
ncbi:LysR family transcriptional regulator [Roseibium sediminicola]|uniref:LysR family transcriptional regulator n=1 Tax=Roseibium sediminicola TaxID=2933272 RepID=A0ABT0GWU7_9HYPH|nr:LysR family transcriptional regulator [Roseibium sp. CAU 1639]MCK7613922.1 LysR family transcriptional regulator [Roseibium sp. CAU 1639]